MIRRWQAIIAVVPVVWFLFDYHAYTGREQERKREVCLQFVDAAGRGDLETVESCWEQGASYDCTGNKGRTALQAAVAGGSVPVIQFLINRGADTDASLKEVLMAGDVAGLKALAEAGISVPGQGGYYALCCAVQRNDVAMVDFLLQKGVSQNSHQDPTGLFNGETPLLRAARYGTWETFLTLVKHGAKLNTRSPDHRTALMLAAFSNMPDSTRICRYLIHHGADLNALDSGGMTALKFASQSGNTAVEDLLIQAGAQQ